MLTTPSCRPLLPFKASKPRETDSVRHVRQKKEERHKDSGLDAGGYQEGPSEADPFNQEPAQGCAATPAEGANGVHRIDLASILAGHEIHQHCSGEQAVAEEVELSFVQKRSAAQQLKMQHSGGSAAPA
jgi:hypothetical protein